MRQLASVQEISDLQPIEGADRIECATILGWKLVTQKGNYKVGDKCIYFEVDSLIPIKEWSKFLEKKEKPGQAARLRTIRLRGQLSQGLIVPMESLQEYVGDDWQSYEVGRDLTETMDIEKYEAPIPACLAGKVRGSFPAIVPKTDEERVQSRPALLDEFRGLKYIRGIKCDGTSGTFMNLEGDHHVCSRNLSLQDDEKNTYWKMYHQHGLKTILNDMGNFSIQGEICGEGIQGNRMGLKGQQLFVFNVRDIKEGRYLCHDAMIEMCNRFELQTVPFDLPKDEADGIFNFDSIDELIELANTMTYPSNGKLAEGMVVRPLEEFYSHTLSGRSSFKVISNAFLEKYGL